MPSAMEIELKSIFCTRKEEKGI